MRILHYLWIDPSDPARRGGGVRGYVHALIAAQADLPGLEVSSLASGLAHDLHPRTPYWRKVRPGHFEIVNSATLAPSHADFATPAQLADAATEAAFADFLTRTGPYDVVHLHGLEGVPARVLAHAAQGSRVLVSLHNYHPFCPQVNLWWNEAAHCTGFDNGRRCATCLPLQPRPGPVRLAYAVESTLARLRMGPGTKAYRKLWQPLMRAGWRGLRRLLRLGPRRGSPAVAPPCDAASGFRQRRAEMVWLLNAHCDAVLAVSERTAQIAQGFGLRAVRCVYIGTDHARHWEATVPRPLPTQFTPDRPLRLAYLGYMRDDKGFGFLLQALQALPRAQSECIHLCVAARRGAARFMQAMASLEPHLAGLTWHDGYEPAALDAILAQVDFGIVPPLWEDNLPQVALEMHARHIPLITSDRGGAQELGGMTELVFRAGDVAALTALLARILSGEAALQGYWDGARAPVSMAQHAEDLMRHYAGAA